MQLINLDDFVILGQGSEWLWTMISGLVLAITFFAIYRQLSLQRNAAAVEQVRTIYREWGDERMARAKLETLADCKAGEPATFDADYLAARLPDLIAANRRAVRMFEELRAVLVRPLAPVEPATRPRRRRPRADAPTLVG